MESEDKLLKERKQLVDVGDRLVSDFGGEGVSIRLGANPLGSTKLNSLRLRCGAP